MADTVKPARLRLEGSSHCQLRCPSCPTTLKEIPAVGSGFLRVEAFRELILANPWVEEIELSNYGEILLNPDLPKIMELAHTHTVRLVARNGVNLNTARDSTLEAMVKYRFHAITCSLDGATQETYSQYRVRGDFDTVMRNVRKLVDYKKQYNSPYPELRWQFIAFEHNSHEILAAKAMADELGMDFHLKLSWDADIGARKDADLIRDLAGYASRAEYREQTGQNYMLSICHQLWDQPQINWDGKNLGCCRNAWGDFGGNAFTDGLEATLNHEKIAYAREMLQGKAPERADLPCVTCEIYQDMRESGNWLVRGPRTRLGRALKRLQTMMRPPLQPS